MAYPSYEAFLNSPEWKAKRIDVLRLADNRCQVCNSTKEIHVHHRSYQNEWGNESLSDLIALCKSCHFIFHKKGSVKRNKRKKKRKCDISQTRKYVIFYKNGNEELVDMAPSTVQELAKHSLVRYIKAVKNI